MKPLHVVLVCLGTLLSVSSAVADTRIALVIGNSRYNNVGVLANPQRDAALVADTLRSEGFDAVLVQDATQAVMIQALNAFNDRADQADWALVYFAGHGIEIGGVDYLLPIDARLRDDRDAQDEAVSLNRVLDTVENARKMRLVILDACRNNPFATTMKRSVASRAITRGLAPIEPQAGIMVVYAAAAGEVAEDGSGDHSPFTTALVNRLKEPGLEVSRLFNVVTADVLDATEHHQRPFEYGSNPSREEFFFKPPLPVEAPPSSSISDAKMWSYLKGSTDSKTLQDFHDVLPPDSPLRGAVEARLEEIQGRNDQVSMLTPPHQTAVPSRDVSTATCEQLAASPYDGGRPPGVEGVSFEKIDSRAAVTACRSAVQAAPEQSRLHLNLGRSLESAKQFAEAKREYETAVAAGNGLAMNGLGALYGRAEGVAQDYAVARSWYEKAAARGIAIAMTNLGVLCEHGQGVAQDYAAARSWFEKGAAAGDPGAMNNLGFVYEKGLGVAQDYAVARSWYEKSAAADDAIAMTNLGVLYEHGHGVAQDYDAARSWFEKGAAAGDPGAMNDLGSLYADGRGVAEDYAVARSWYEKGAAAAGVAP